MDCSSTGKLPLRLAIQLTVGLQVIGRNHSGYGYASAIRSKG